MYYVGIDVASQESAVCILDSKGKIVREAKRSTDPEALGRFLADTGLAIERVGLESGCTAAWLFTGLQERGWPVICIDARHAAAALQAGFRNKNDRNDARGIAPEAQRHGRMLTARATLQSQLVALENTIRGLLRQEGISLPSSRMTFAAAVHEAMGADRLLRAAVLPLLETRDAVLRQRAVLDRAILMIVRVDPICRLLMTAPGVGALAALSFKVAVDDPQRFARSRNVGAHFGLTPREYSSGERSYHGRISKMGDPEVRLALPCREPRVAPRCRIVVSAQSLGCAPGATCWHQESASRVRPQTRGRAACHVDPRHGVPLAAGGCVNLDRIGGPRLCHTRHSPVRAARPPARERRGGTRARYPLGARAQAP